MTAPTVRRRLEQAAFTAEAAAAVIARYEHEVVHELDISGRRGAAAQLRATWRMLRRDVDAIRAYLKCMPDSLRDWQPGDLGETAEDCGVPAELEGPGSDG